jgi:hypothetical protein
MHTYNGAPVQIPPPNYAGEPTSHPIDCVCSECVATLMECAGKNVLLLREALRAALALIDELKDGHKGQWTVPEVLRLAEIRALVGDG